MWIIDFEEDQRIENERFNNRLDWIVSDLKLNLSILDSKVNCKEHEQYNRWYANAIKYIEDNWLY